LLGRVALEELYPLVPLGDVVGVLPKHDRVEQLGAAGDEELEALEPTWDPRGEDKEVVNDNSTESEL
jgi:hypothetical protein